MATIPGADTKWFVEINGEVSGPILSIDIIKSLESGQIKVTYRVSKDRVNWKAICNEEHFEILINKLINSMTNSVAELSPETKTPRQEPQKTDAPLIDSAAISMGISQQLQHAQKLTEMNVEANALRRILVAISIQKKTIVHIKSTGPGGIHVDDASQYIIEKSKIKSYFNFKKHFKLFLLLILVIGAGAAQIAYVRYSEDKERKQIEQNERLKKEAEYNVTVGNYEKALNLYHEINDPKALDAKTILGMAEVTMKQKNFAEANQLCQKALTLTTDQSERAVAHSLIGLAELNSGHLDAAATQFQTSLTENPNQYSSLHNLGIVYLNQKSYDAAETILLKALTLSEKKEAATLLALFEVTSALEQNPPFERLKRLEQSMREYGRTFDDFGAELILAQIRIAKLRKDNALAETLTRQFININPNTVQDRPYRLDLNYDLVNWNHLYTWCVDLYAKESKSAIMNAFMATCMFQVKSPQEALPYSRFAQQSLPHDFSIRGQYAFLLNTTSNANEASELLKNEREENLSNLSLLTLAKICDEKKTQDCSIKYWTKLLAQAPNDLSAISNVALIKGRQGDQVGARKLINDGLAKRPGSKELLAAANKFGL